MNDSQTGGYINPAPQPPTLATVPPGLTFAQFIQTVLVGLSGLSGTLVRPSWQKDPPQQPDIDVNWVAFGLEGFDPDFNAFIGYNDNDQVYLRTNEKHTLTISTYGPGSYDLIGMIRDGFQLTQNLGLLRQANIGFNSCGRVLHAPDLVNERWIDRWRMEVILSRQIQRFYPISNFVSMSGTIYSQTAENENFQQPFAAGDK